VLVFTARELAAESILVCLALVRAEYGFKPSSGSGGCLPKLSKELHAPQPRSLFWLDQFANGLTLDRSRRHHTLGGVAAMSGFAHRMVPPAALGSNAKDGQ